MHIVGEKDGAELEDGTSVSLADGEVEKEGVPDRDGLCGNVIMFVTTSVAVSLADDRAIPSAIDSAIKTIQNTASVSLAFSCFHHGSCGSRGVAMAT